LNLRVLEILASGGFLLTDRLGIESGFDALFTDRRHLVAYDDIEDCIEKSRRYLRDALSAAAIARAGHAAYETLLAPERIRSDFFALCESGVVRSEFEIGTDRRCGPPRVHQNDALMRRIATYEVLQALQLAQETSAVLATPAADPYLLSDAADLVRVELAADAIDDDGGKLDAFLTRAGVASRVRRLRGAGEIREKRWDAVLATRADWRSRRYDPVFARNASALLIVSDLGDDAEASRALEAAGFKRLTDVAPVFTAPTGKRQSRVLPFNPRGSFPSAFSRSRVCLISFDVEAKPHGYIYTEGGRAGAASASRTSRSSIFRSRHPHPRDRTVRDSADRAPGAGMRASSLSMAAAMENVLLEMASRSACFHVRACRRMGRRRSAHPGIGGRRRHS